MRYSRSDKGEVMVASNGKSLVEVHTGGEFHWVGNGFPVRSIFGYSDLGQKLSPFLLLDYAAPYRFQPGSEKRGVGAHPHRGFETVTIVYQGEIEHRDSNGGGGIIGPGDVQWMTAASGLIHDEFHSPTFTREGGMFEMVQLWVNLPARFKSAAPGYQTLRDASIPRVALPEGAGTARIIAGELTGGVGPAKTFTPINLWDVQLPSAVSMQLPMPPQHNRAVFVLRGGVAVEGEKASLGELVTINSSGESVRIEASSETRLLVMTGMPLGEPIVGYGPFVMNTKAEILQAYADYQDGKLGNLT